MQYNYTDMANAIRFLSADAIDKSNSGHPGMPLGMADVATVLFSKFIKINPKEPRWFNRDRFVLSAGHGSMLMYSLLYLLGYEDIDFVKLDEAAHFVPSGMDVWEGRKEKFDLTVLRCYRYLKDTKRLERSLGTLGGGNHFIEVDQAQDGRKYLVIHTGSRNLGKQVADYYQGLAIELGKGKEEYFDDSEKFKQYLLNNPINNATILIKGSRSTKMEILKDVL
jgi:hypothetical protein